MAYESFRWLAAVIAEHQNKTVEGRLRLQKTMKLLQRLGFPTEYSFSMYHYGPYSEGIQSDLSLLSSAGVIEEKERRYNSGGVRYDIIFNREIPLPKLDHFQEPIKILEKAAPVTLELAATYLAFREYGLEDDDAIEALKDKKEGKFTEQRFKTAMKLLEDLEIPGLTTA
ncbi:MAG TPA: hypothetical protein VFH95_10775 [Candidatus Kapabacteria bacterium]|nr:hypothetical protein [Candidatus Kapabacteria bacterium]